MSRGRAPLADGPPLGAGRCGHAVGSPPCNLDPQPAPLFRDNGWKALGERMIRIVDLNSPRVRPMEAEAHERGATSRYLRTVATAIAITDSVAAFRPASAQTARHDRGYSAGVGIGPSAPYDFSVTLTASARYRRVLVRLRYAAAAELLGDFDDDVGLLVGVAVTPASWFALLSIGTGVGRMRAVGGCLFSAVRNCQW